MSFRVVLGQGFHPSGKRTFWNVEEWIFPSSPKDFFAVINEYKGRYLLFFATFESGYQFLELRKSKKVFLPSFGVAVLSFSRSPHTGKGSFTATYKGSSLSKEEYLKGFEKIKTYIASGDIYQVNYTVRFDFIFEGDALTLWENFIQIQPVPYAVYFESEDFAVMGGSMELFLRKRGKFLESKPIKGTLSKNVNPTRFFSLEKELAENLMITDMVRNDLGRVAHIGTVKVPELFKVETYKTVHQLMSRVICQTDRKFDDIFESTFPPASVTGAPKRRAVEIINELEPHSREIYCGTVGLMLPNGGFTANVSIRTAFVKNDQKTLHYYAGGGIVWDSLPQNEWNEVLLKLKAFEEAIKAF